jgi:putative flippase GtrA
MTHALPTTARWGDRALNEAKLALKFAAVSLLGFGVDAVVLSIALRCGLEPAWARLISLFCAMQVTFVINRRHVFRAHEAGSVAWQWLRYMGSNGVGNACNYWIFVTMVSTHWPVVAAPMVALAAGSFAAWLINFLCNRYFVFRVAKVAAVEAIVRLHPPLDDLHADRLAGDRPR